MKRTNNGWILILVISLVAGFGTGTAAGQARSVLDFTLDRIEGQPEALSAYRGRW